MKPCPFCGSTGVLDPLTLAKDSGYAHCSKSSCPMFLVRFPLAAWNTRHHEFGEVHKFVARVVEYGKRVKRTGNVCAWCDMGAAGPGPSGEHDPDCMVTEAVAALAAEDKPQGEKK